MLKYIHDQNCHKESYVCFKSHFSWSLTGYNNRLTVHVDTITKLFNSLLYWGLILKDMWHSQVLRWSLNGCKLSWPSRQLAGNYHNTSWWDWAVMQLHFVKCGPQKQHKLRPFDCLDFWTGTLITLWLRTTLCLWYWLAGI